MYLENTLKRICLQNSRNQDEQYSEHLEEYSNKEVFLETSTHNDISNVKIISIPDIINLSCYFQPHLVESNVKITGAKDRIYLYENQQACEAISLMYNNYGSAYSQNSKIDICGKIFETFEIDINGMEIGRVKYEFQTLKELRFNQNEIDMYAYGGSYKFGYHPALIEQQIFHIANDGKKIFPKISKISDWNNKGIDPTKSQFVRSGINKQMNFHDILNEYQKMNIATLINIGYFKIEVTSDFGNIHFKSKHFKHIDNTNYLDVAFERY